MANGFKATTRQLVSTACWTVSVGWSINKGMVTKVEANMGAAMSALISTQISNKPKLGCNTTKRTKSVGVCTLAGSIQ